MDEFQEQKLIEEFSKLPRERQLTLMDELLAIIEADPEEGEINLNQWWLDHSTPVSIPHPPISPDRKCEFDIYHWMETERKELLHARENPEYPIAY